MTVREARAFQEAVDRVDPIDPPDCTVPPPGWGCLRSAGHDGPCAAFPYPAPPSVWEQIWVRFLVFLTEVTHLIGKALGQ